MTPSDELAKLRAQVRCMRLAFAHLPGIIVGLYDLSGRCVLLEGANYLSVTAAEGKHYNEFLPPERREKFLWMFTRATLGLETRADYPIGELMFESTTRPVLDELGAVQFVMICVRDVTSDRAQAVALAERGGRDSLTGLARRSVLTAHVEGLVRKRKSFAVLFMDLDGFKAVNDTMGHKAGDLVLENVARALRGSTRAGDLAVRLGGDEFAVILAESTNPEDAAKRLLSKVLEVTEPFGAGASVGVAIYPQHGGTLDELLAAADVAMYRAKKVRGGDVVEVAEA